ncbi:MAG TPA: c-type cytochrome [Rhodanobacteraceae bacterium]|nr:c-type cytochrome [Rhodanobacteraceae bacterium]
MKHTHLLMSAAVASAIALAAAVAVQAAPPGAVPSGQQLQRVPVSGLHMGGPGSTLTNPYADDRAAWVEGRKLFKQMNCAGCHAPKGGGGMGPALSDHTWLYGSSPGNIYLTILHGRPNGMPQWGTRLPPQAIWALVTYVKTLEVPGDKNAPFAKRKPPQNPGNPTPPSQPPGPKPAKGQH